jgi:5-methyltetrahydropteroyltriglutamate--homocysteine methyltransferase
MIIPTKPIGGIPRPQLLIERLAKTHSEDPAPAPVYESAVEDTITSFESTGSPVVRDGEQRKYHNSWTYCVHGLPNTGPFSVDVSTMRQSAFRRIRARVAGAQLTADILMKR